MPRRNGIKERPCWCRDLTGGIFLFIVIVEVPRKLWYSGNIKVRLNYLYYKVSTVRDELETSQEHVGELVETVDHVQQRIGDNESHPMFLWVSVFSLCCLLSVISCEIGLSTWQFVISRGWVFLLRCLVWSIAYCPHRCRWIACTRGLRNSTGALQWTCRDRGLCASTYWRHNESYSMN